MSRNAIAHVRQSNGLRQLLIDHLFETSSIAGQLASKLNLSLAAELLGLLHDFGRYSQCSTGKTNRLLFYYGDANV
ncbi:hypothetical protein [Aggregatibacter actinomycetemcomitans]|uniref:hypothetical protein n=1 Tax=Aggregatibacter actinomycetemcomitans TaxID=714 RepID=UPI00022AC533|nr:hypothetical protein [Aggregatibacter actinomycetemcomitans]AMQ91579.1 CRISPR-associated protein Cas3 [Aggregatibacter actinomycetemcomitans]ANN81549.1 CRISPR-associated protein Cas3 [Aggregatibacter actinomycetemcomitans D11S-1]KND83646.1 CRISPR-associated protein Cas3 [Aggregatibacter actinomycetemcomitans serotype b str. SCC1398]KOE52865.1 CRISPR-associated protein Cas3 [Aggregatibacter actinomycetemcomitans serotype b str. SCC4092]KOE53269.1 CRISPR-associated protein Cas3 [Aggregatibact